VSVHPPGTRWYNAVWRWHFYAGLFCIPFVLWLAATGSIYLWRPQIEAWLDRPYSHLALDGPTASPDAQVAAALSAVPGASFDKYIVPQHPDDAVSILLSHQGSDVRVRLNPQTLAVLQIVEEEHRPMRRIFHLHGELLAGAWGSYLVETAACWAIVMILTGLYLWWPRGRRRLAGVLYPRLRLGKRVLWRDLHATAGIWVSFFALFLILTGLPWAQGWGSYLKEVRTLTHASDGPPDWLIGGQSADVHAGHAMMKMATPPLRPGELERVIATARGMTIEPPVLIEAPRHAGSPWHVESDAADRPLRAEMTVDGATGRVLSFKPFAERQWIDRVVGYGVAIHEGAHFGILNQIVGTLTALALMLLSISGAIMWWRRRPIGLLGAPIPLTRPRFGAGLIAAIVLLGLYLPMFGLTLVATLMIERLVLRHLPGPRRWLTLRTA
jgi:uncharacterized iron-regulated membrane protein